MVFGRHDCGDAGGGHGGEQNTGAGYNVLQPHQVAAQIDDSRNQNQPYKNIVQGVAVNHVLQVHCSQDGADEQHGHGGIGGAQGLNGSADNPWQLELPDQQHQTNLHGDDAGMGEDFLQQFPAAGADGEIGQPEGPHEAALGNQVDGGVHQPQGAEGAFRNGISQDSGVGADGGVLQHPLPRAVIPRIENMAQGHSQKLNHNGGKKYGNAALQDAHVKFNQKRFHDAAGQGHIDDQVGEQFPSFWVDGALFSQNQAEHHDENQYSLHLEQIG